MGNDEFLTSDSHSSIFLCGGLKLPIKHVKIVTLKGYDAGAYSDFLLFSVAKRKV